MEATVQNSCRSLWYTKNNTTDLLVEPREPQEEWNHKLPLSGGS